MDFGKKGDAKKAMKLHWKEGISLKAAWKRVKGGKKTTSSRKRTRSSPKRKKAQSNAKKAMRIHHREGISLKQAWKRVNRFGTTGLTFDSDCPPGYESNPQITGKPCLKKCGFYEMRNPQTNKCVKMKMVKPSVSQPFNLMDAPIEMSSSKRGRGRPPLPKVLKAPPMGYELGPTGRIRKICGPDQYRDPVTGRCRTVKSSAMAFAKNHYRCGFGSCSACAMR